MTAILHLASVHSQQCSEAIVTEQSKPTEKRTRQRTSRAPARPDQIAYTIAQVQEVGGPGRTKVYELVAEGKLKMVHVCGRSRITGASLRLLLGASEQDVFIGQRSHDGLNDV